MDDPLPSPLSLRLFHAAGRWRSRYLLWRFEAAARDARRINLSALQEILKLNEGCDFGRVHGFGSMAVGGDPSAFQAQVPLQTWEDVEPWVERMAQGEVGVLTAEEVIFFAVSSGTTGRGKRVPVTARHGAFQERYYAGLIPAVPSLSVPGADGPHRGVLLVSAGGERPTTPGGIRLGSASNDGIRRVQRIIPYLWTSPWPAFQAAGTASSWYLHALFGLRDRDAKFLHGIFASHLLEWLGFVRARWGCLVADIEAGRLDPSIEVPVALRGEIAAHLRPDPARAAELRAVAEEGWDAWVPRAWPRLAYVSAVITGGFAHFVPRLRRLIGDLPIHTTVYSASEAMVGLNLELDHPERYVLATGCAHFEFIPLESAGEAQPATVGLEALEVGRSYEVVITNYAGLYRYRLGDVVRIEGFYHQAPVMSFGYRRGTALNLAGEKVTEAQLRAAVDRLARRALRDPAALVDFSVAPDVSASPPRYVFYLEVAGGGELSTREASQELDAALWQSNNLWKVHRGEDMRLDAPAIRLVSPGSFAALTDWRAARTPAGRNQLKTPTTLVDPAHIQFLEERRLAAAGARR